MKTIEYIYRGGVEVGTGGPGYKWRNGYSPNSEDGSGAPTYPWMTKQQCQADARARGATAVFIIPPARVAKPD